MFSNSLLVFFTVIIGTVLPLVISLYGAYWAFNIRRAFVIPIYRYEALWLGILCLLFSTGAYLSIYPLALGIADVIGAAIIFGFVDSVVPVARRSDPLVRDILHWKTLRLVLWTMIAVSAIPGVYVISVGLADNPYSLLAWGVILMLSAPAFVFGPLVLSISAKRSRDSVLRNTLKWISIALALELSQAFAYAIVVFQGIGALNLYNYPTLSYLWNYSYPSFPSAIIVVFVAYAFYKSARSLEPLDRISPSLFNETEG